MPIYEYRCGACGVQKEFLQRISEPPLTECPECGQPALTKLVSAAGFQLKGTGWYVTDFRDKPKPASKAADKSGETPKASDGAAKEGAKTEAASTPAKASPSPTEKV